MAHFLPFVNVVTIIIKLHKPETNGQKIMI